MAREKNIQKKVETFFLLFEEIKQLASETRTASTEIDRELSNVYHKIEGYEITHVSQSHKLVKELKSVLSKRRKLKVENSLLTSLVDQLGGQMGNVRKKTKDIVSKHAEIVAEIKFRAK